MVVTLAQPVVVDAPALAPPGHGLVASAQTAPATLVANDRWRAGIVVMPNGCTEPAGERYDCDTPWPAAPPLDRPGEVGFAALRIYIEDHCDSKGYTAGNYASRLKAAIEVGTSKAIERDLWTGSGGPGGFYLQDPANAAVVLNVTPDGTGDPQTDEVSAVDPVIGLAALSQALSDCGVGAKGMIHLPAHLGELVVVNLKEEGPRLVTKTRGDVVVIGTGYPGTGPTGHAQATPPPGTAWAYATSGIFSIALSDAEVLPDTLAAALDRSTNTIFYTVERYSVVYGNECCTYAVLVNSTPGDSV